MIAFVDTSVLMTAFHRTDDRHGASIRILGQYPRDRVYTSGHNLAETYSVITSFPGRLRAGPHDALLFLSELRKRLSLVVLDGGEYFDVIDRCAKRVDIGGSIYDAFIGACAMKAGAEVLYSWNKRDFQRLFPDKPGWCVTPAEHI